MQNSDVHRSRVSVEANYTGTQALAGKRSELKNTSTILLPCRGRSFHVTVIKANVVNLDCSCSNITGSLFKSPQTPGPRAPTYNLITLSSTHFPHDGSGTLPWVALLTSSGRERELLKLDKYPTQMKGPDSATCCTIGVSALPVKFSMIYVIGIGSGFMMLA